MKSGKDKHEKAVASIVFKRDETSEEKQTYKLFDNEVLRFSRSRLD